MGEERVSGFDERQRRRAQNEASFRAVNESLVGLNKAFAEFSGEFAIVCECDDNACVEQIEITPEEYESVRADPRLFAVKPGHDSPAVEVLERDHGSYYVVRKKPGTPEEIAVATDPRAR